MTEVYSTNPAVPADSLPPEYRLLSGGPIDIKEVIALYDTSQLFGYSAPSFWHRHVKGSLAVTAVAHETEGLVGIGTLSKESLGAILGCLYVHCKHRHNGIGQLLVRQRIAIADEMGISHLSMIPMYSNSVLPLYKELGFKEHDNKLTRLIENS